MTMIHKMLTCFAAYLRLYECLEGRGEVVDAAVVQPRHPLHQAGVVRIVVLLGNRQSALTLPMTLHFRRTTVLQYADRHKTG